MDVSQKKRFQSDELKASKDIFKKSSLQLNLYISRVNNVLHVALDGSVVDIDDFGLELQKFHEFGKEIEIAARKIF